MNLKDKLIGEGKTRWLNVGCGDNFEDGFFYLDIFPQGVIDPSYKDRYFRLDIVNAPEEILSKLGRFDFVRMQHVLEHFSFEEGQVAIRNCARLLKNKGIFLITTPDLGIHAKNYLRKKHRDLYEFKQWAVRRIPKEAPSSFYFSIFAHGIAYGGQHQWCYDYEGIKYQLECSGEFGRIQEVKKNSPLASIPFTHNRPEEDVCVIAIKSRRGLWGH